MVELQKTAREALKRATTPVSIAIDTFRECGGVPAGTTTDLKARIENCIALNGGPFVAIPEGTVIVAALHLGAKGRRFDESPSMYFREKLFQPATTKARTRVKRSGGAA